MDEWLIITLVEQVTTGRQRADNGHTSAQITKVLQKVYEKCRVVVAEKNVRSRLKTLKKEYLEFRELYKQSGFGWDPKTGRLTAEPNVWENYLAGKPGAEKLKGKVCPHFEDLGIIFGNDTATGDQEVTGTDFSPMSGTNVNIDVDDFPDEDDTLGQQQTQQIPSISSKRSPNEKGSRARRKKRRTSQDDTSDAICSLVECSKRMAAAMEMQATQNIVNCKVLVDNLKAMGIEEDDILELITIFEHDENSAKMFMGIEDERLRERYVYRKLGRQPPN